MPTNSIDHRWTVGAEAKRVECSAGHAEVIGSNDTVTVCTHRNGRTKVECGLSRKVIQVGPYAYNPADAVDKTRIQGILTWP